MKPNQFRVMKTALSFIFAVAVGMVSTVGCSDKSAFYTNSLRSDIFSQKYNNQQYDFLFVEDNSQSMAPRRQAILNEMQNFLSILNSRKAIDFQMAATVTDYMDAKGALLKNPTTGAQVVASSTSANPVADFGAILNNVNLNSATSFWEQGLESAYQAISQYGSVFSRQGVPLVVVIMSDEDDYSCAANCWGLEPEHNTSWVPFTLDRYFSFFTTYKANQGSTLEWFNIIQTNLTECNADSVGTRYMAVLNAVNTFGASGSICDNDLLASYDNIARMIADRGVKFTLSSPASGNGISVYVNSQLVPNDPNNYIFDSASNSIIFTGTIPPNGSTIEVTYNQVTN